MAERSAGDSKSIAKELVKPKSNEHVLYAPKVKIVPDTHGLDPAHYGVDKNSKDVISIGDLIDNPKESSRYTKSFDEDPSTRLAHESKLKNAKRYGWGTIAVSGETEAEYYDRRAKQKIEWDLKAAAMKKVDIRKSVETWSHLMENDQGQVVLGNHEALAMSGIAGHDEDLMMWLCDTNQGTSTLEAFGIKVDDLPRISYDSRSKEFEKPIPTAEQLAAIRQRIGSNPELSKFFDLLQKKGKLYAIANETLIVHAGIALDKEGHLIAPQRAGANWEIFDGTVVGLDALDKIEEGIRKRDARMLHMLAAGGGSDQMSPLHMRQPFFNIMKDENAAQTAITELSKQAQARGADIKIIAIGHSEAVGGKAIGKFVLGTDTSIGDVVTLDASSNKKVEIQSRHNFDIKGKMIYGLTNEIKGSEAVDSSKSNEINSDTNKDENLSKSPKESAETKKSRKGNASVLIESKKELTEKYDVEFADDVTSGIVAAGYEGDDESRTSSSTLKNHEDIKSNLAESGFAIASVSEIIANKIDPELNKDLEALVKKGKAGTKKEYRDLGKRQEKINDTIYKALKGDSSEKGDPNIQIVEDEIKKLKKMTVEEIIDLAKNDNLKNQYLDWQKSHPGEKAFKPRKLEEELLNDLKNINIRMIVESGRLKQIEQEDSPLKINLGDHKPITSLSTTLASVYGDVGGIRVKTDAFGVDKEYEAEAREAIEVGVERTAAMADTENKSKWAIKRKEGQSWLSYAGEVAKNTLDRSWRTMFSDKLHQAKEVRHGLRMMAEAGVETGLTPEFISKVDAEARARIEKSRQEAGFFGRLKANTKDFISEVFGHERELHNVKEQIISEWRKKFDASPFDAKDNPIFDLVMSDLDSRSEIARRVAESTQETLHLSGEAKSKQTIKVDKDSIYGQFLNDNVFLVATKDAVARQKAGETVTGLSPKLRVELDKKLNEFHQTSAFKKWKSTLSAEEQALIPDVFTYASDVLDQVDGSLIPNALEMSDYYDKAKKLDIDIDLTIGIAQHGPNGEISPEGIRSVKLKKEVMDRMRERSDVFAAQDVDGGIKRAMLVAASVSEVVNNPLGWSIAGFFGGRMVMTAARSAGGAVGIGIFGGVKAGMREWTKLGMELKQVDIEKAIGLVRAEDALKYQKLESFTNRSVIMSEQASNIDATIKAMSEGEVKEGDISKLMALLINGEARVSLGVKRGINLIGAKSTGKGELAERQNYQLERRLFDLSQAKARAQIKHIADSKPELWGRLKGEWGFNTDASVDTILDTMRLDLEENLIDGISIPTKYETVLGTMTLKEEESIKGRAKAFAKFRLGTSIKQGALVGVTAGLFSWGLGEVTEHFHHTVETVETVSQTTVSPELPLNKTGIDIGTLDGTAMHAYLPQGMTMIPMSSNVDGHADYSIFLDSDKGHALVTGVHFGTDGKPIISEAVQSQLTAHNLTVTPQPLASHTIVDLITGEPKIVEHIPTEGATIRFGDLQGSDEGGFWNWMMSSMRGHNTDVDINTQTNGSYKLFRLYELMRNNDNVEIQKEAAIPYFRDVNFKETLWEGRHVQEFVPAANPTNMIIKDLPALFATPEGHQKIGDLVAESVRQTASGAKLDKLHEIIYKTAYLDQMPTAAEGKYLFDQLGVFEPTTTEVQPGVVETITSIVTPYDTLINVTQPIVEEVGRTVNREVVDGFAVGLPLLVAMRKRLEAAEPNQGVKPIEKFNKDVESPNLIVEEPIVEPKVEKEVEPEVETDVNDTDIESPNLIVEEPIVEPKVEPEVKPEARPEEVAPKEKIEKPNKNKSRQSQEDLNTSTLPEVEPVLSGGPSRVRSSGNGVDQDQLKDKGNRVRSAEDLNTSTLPEVEPELEPKVEPAVEPEVEKDEVKKNPPKTNTPVTPKSPTGQAKKSKSTIKTPGEKPTKESGKKVKDLESTLTKGAKDIDVASGNEQGELSKNDEILVSNLPTEAPIIETKDEPLVEVPKNEVVDKKKLKEQLKANISIEMPAETAEDLDLPLADVKQDVLTHMKEGQSLADFATLEYGAIADFIAGLSDNQIETIFKSMAGHPELQAKYRAAMIGLQVLPEVFRRSKDQYSNRINGAKKRVSELEGRLDLEKNKRLASIFDADFPAKFNAKLEWGESTKDVMSLDTLPSRAEGTIHLPENIEVDNARFDELITHLNSDYQATQKYIWEKLTNRADVNYDNPEEVNRYLKDEIIKQTKDKKNLGAGWNDKEEKYLNKLTANAKKLSKLETKIQTLTKLRDSLSTIQDKTIDISTYDLPALGGRPAKKGISGESLTLLSCFKLDGKTLDENYVLSPDAKVDWKVKGELIDTVHQSKDLHVEWDDNAAENSHHSVDLHFVDDNHTPDAASLAILKQAGFWDQKNGYKSVTSNNPLENINRSPEEIDRIGKAIEEQQAIMAEYQKLVDTIGDEETPGSFAHQLAEANKLIENQLYNYGNESGKMDILRGVVQDQSEVNLDDYPFAKEVFNGEAAVKPFEAIFQPHIEDLILGAILVGENSIIDSMPPQIKKRWFDLREQVNLDDLAILQYYRNLNQPQDLTDKNRAKIYERDFTQGEAIKFVLDDQASGYRKMGATPPYDRKDILSSLSKSN